MNMESLTQQLQRALWATWKDENGSSEGELAIVIGLIALAGTIWFIQLGGEEGLAEAMSSLGRTTRTVRHILPR